MQTVSVWVIPIAITLIITIGMIKKVPVFSEFIIGAKDGFENCIGLLPPLIGLLSAVSLLRQSGAMEMIEGLLAPITQKIGIPEAILPLVLLRPISGSGSIALLEDIFKSYGPDSAIGRMTAIMAGSTETTVYTVTVYLGAVGIKNARHVLPAAFIGDFVCTVTAIAIVNLSCI